MTKVTINNGGGSSGSGGGGSSLRCNGGGGGCEVKGWQLETGCVVEDNFSYFILVSIAKVMSS